MAFTLDQDVKQRAYTLEEIGGKELTEKDIRTLNFRYRRDFMETLGYDIGENWENSVPFAGTTPRMYLMQLDDQGKERKK